MATKRERSINWEKEEKQLLRVIIKPFMKVIENKDISTNTNKAKVNAWTEITEQFNRANKRFRDKKQLMNQWKLNKLNLKKEISMYKRQTSQTGGGPKPPSPSPDTLELIPQEFEVDYNEFDCDGIQEIKGGPKVDLNFKDDNDSVNILINEEVDDKLPLVQSASQLTPSTSQPVLIFTEQTASSNQPAPTTSQSETPKRSAKKNKLMQNQNSFDFGQASFDDMHRFRVLENERLQKEHDLRMKTMTEISEIHAQVLKNLKLQEEMLFKMLQKSNEN